MDVLGSVETFEHHWPMREVIHKVEGGLLERHRWLVAVGAVMIQMSLGAIYAWGVFTAELTDPNGEFGFSNTQTQWIFSVGLASFAAMMLVSARLMKRVGPRPVAIAGGILLGAGYGLAGFFGDTFVVLLICIGILGGAGIGLAYIVPIAVGMRWFPDRKGLMTGLAVAGFGFGALFWVQLAGDWGRMIERIGLLDTFILLSIIFGLLVHAGGLLMAFPSEGWKPSGWNPPEPSQGTRSRISTRSEMLRTPGFYTIWLSFMFLAMAGLMLVGINKLFGRDALVESGWYEDPLAAGAAASTAYAVSFALANGLGRIGWGAISDRTGWRLAIVLMAVTQGLLMFGFFQFGGNLVALYIFLALTGFNFGGNFALFPLATASRFGTQAVGANYPLVFTSYGIGGIAGPIMAGGFKDAATTSGTDAWLLPFMIAGSLCLVAGVLIALTQSRRSTE